ncbi:toll-like receptor 3 [Aphidius gifuensis]|uniref:toll-like receptor 3 n=1 Tax=Aphidius gifuensis TaxID=684658 RepID=UPI001CDD66D0|nr:toll-like receptor 3 [Aphidius gifuensis]
MGPQNQEIFCEPPKPWEEYQTCFVGRWTSLIPIDKQIEKLEKIRLTSDIVNIIKNDAFKPFYLSATTLILDLPDQEIIVEPDAFKAMSQLTTLEINNAIVPLTVENFELNEESFTGLEKLEVLKLRTKSIPFEKSVFYPLKSLIFLEISIDLSYNNISLIENGAFANLTNLDHLHVDHNYPSLTKDLVAWSITESQIDTECQRHNTLEICFKHNSISSVNVFEEKIARPSTFGAFIEIHTREIRFTCGDFVTSISPNAFKDSNIKSELKTLKIYRKRRNGFVLYPGSFEGLTVLENLIIDVGVIELKVGLFDSLKSLKYLKFKPNEMLTGIYLGQVLANLTNLKTLEIFNNDSISICQSPFSNQLPQSITELCYTNGQIDTIETASFMCLPSLENITITKTQLAVVERYAFDGLDNIKYINLSFNRIHLIDLTHNNIETIESGAFNGSQIKVIYLYDNKLDEEDDAIYGDLDNKTRLYLNYQPNEISSTSLISVKQLVPVLDLSFNSLQSIHEKTFKGENIKNLDLSYNNISLIENGAFANMTSLDHLHVDHNNPSLTEDLVAWSIMESQIDTECQRHNTLEICFKHNSISSVNVNEEKIARPSTFGAFIEIHTREIRFTCDDFVTSISPNAFKDSNIKSELKTLKIYRKRRNGFVLYPGSFEGLTVLENLIIDVGVIELKVGLFDSLKSLKYLKFKPNEMLTGVYLGQVLANLTNLKTLEIFNNDSIGICDSPFSDILPLSITELCYTNGQIDKLEKYSFICLPSLENITITKTRLAVVEYAFDILDNLKYINLAFNQIRQLDLSNNKIGIIEDAAFEGTSINDIYLFDNPYIILNRHAWMVSRYTLLFSNKISYTAIRCQSKQQNKCITCHYNCLQPQDRALIEPIVMS